MSRASDGQSSGNLQEARKESERPRAEMSATSRSNDGQPSGNSQEAREKSERPRTEISAIN